MGTKRKAPAALVELCHDALAEGVLVKHDGLPESWLAMFKAHPAAWAQLQKEVLAPEKRLVPYGRELTEESTVLISYRRTPWDTEDQCYRDEHYQFVTPASALPKWLFVLMKLSLEIAPVDLRVDGTGGNAFVFRRPADVAEVWKEIRTLIFNDDVFPDDLDEQRLRYEALHDMFISLNDETGGDLYMALEEKLFMDVVEIALDLERTIKSNRDAFADVITDALHHPILLESDWADTLNQEHRVVDRKATYIRAPALSLHFDYARWYDAQYDVPN